MVRIGLIGYGYWGPNLARNLYRCPEISLTRIVDFSDARQEAAAREWPGVKVSAYPDTIFHDSDLDAVVIATPIETHHPLALSALKNGKHVLVEKPMTSRVDQAEELLRVAKAQNRLLMVDHTFVYTEAVRWIARFVESGELGEVYYFDSIRANLGLFQRDASVLWDLAPHDLSILTAIMPRPVRTVSARGASHAGSRVPDIAYITLDMGEECLAHFHVSWLAPVKLRRTLIAGSKKMIVYDDLETLEKIKVYDSGVQIAHDDSDGKTRMQVEYRVGDLMSPALKSSEALATEVRHFAACIQGKEQPIVTGEQGLQVVKLLAAAEQSMKEGGVAIRV